MKKYIGILLVFMFSLFSAPVIADSSTVASDAVATIKAVNSTVEAIPANIEGVNKNLVFVTGKIENAIDQLSTKLGVAAEQVWSILVRQASVNAWISLLMLIVPLLIGLVLLLLQNKFLKEDKHGRNAYFNDEGAIAAPMIIGTIISVLWLIYGLFGISDIFTGFINPEYWALEQILDAL